MDEKIDAVATEAYDAAITGCDYCRGVHYTDEPFPVRTQMGNWIEVAFNYCPYCGRDLRYE